MKKLVLICILCCYAASLIAQGNTFFIEDNNFDKNASIKILSPQKAIITIDDIQDTLLIEVKDKLILLKNKADNEIFLNKLKISPALVDASFSQYVGINSLEKLLTNANELPLQTLYIKGKSQLQTQPETNSNGSFSGDNGALSPGMWMLFILTLLAGLLLGFFIGKVVRRNAIESKIELEEEVVQNRSTVQSEGLLKEKTKSGKANVTINQLKLKYDKLNADNKALKLTSDDLREQIKALNATLQSDNNYYKIAFQDVVLPLQNAIDKGNVSEIFKYVTISALVFSAITREKLAKRQNYDITNLNNLLKHKADHHNYPELTQLTPVDKTPLNLRQTISILKQLGIKDLDNYIFQGYIIRNL